MYNHEFYYIICFDKFSLDPYFLSEFIHLQHLKKLEERRLSSYKPVSTIFL